MLVRAAVYFLHGKLGKKKVVHIPSCIGENLNISSILFIILSGAIERALSKCPRSSICRIQGSVRIISDPFE